jgi:hypothetical protein
VALPESLDTVTGRPAQPSDFMDQCPHGTNAVGTTIEKEDLSCGRVSSQVCDGLPPFVSLHFSKFSIKFVSCLGCSSPLFSSDGVA